MFRLEEETMYGFGGEAIANKVDVSDNVVVPCEREIGEEF
jgi:hypothetical protein